MSAFKNPFNPDLRLHRGGCTCGRHDSQEAHDAEVRGEEAIYSRVVESTVVRALFPEDETRRNFIRAVGAGTALAAIAQFFPLGAAKALASEGAGPIEKKDLKIGFIPITCATPLIMPNPWASTLNRG